MRFFNLINPKMAFTKTISKILNKLLHRKNISLYLGSKKRFNLRMIIVQHLFIKPEINLI